MRKGLILMCLTMVLLPLGIALPAEVPATSGAPENVYRGELVTYPGPWAFEIPQSGIILVRDDELETLASDPDKALNISTDRQPQNQSLRQICERAQARGERTLTIAFDHFFAQYRPGQDTPRRLMPDTDEYIQKMAAISRFASGYGLGLAVEPAHTSRTGQGLYRSYRRIGNLDALPRGLARSQNRRLQRAALAAPAMGE